MESRQPSDDRIQGPWWKIYGDPLLSSLEDKVAISNQNIKMAEAQFQQARALVMAARSAYFPTIGIGASFARSSNSTTTSSNVGIPIQRTNTLGLFPAG